MRDRLQWQHLKFPELSWVNLSLVCAILALLPINWGIEALKWKLALSGVLRLNFSEAYKSVIAGTATGVITPNRVGEFAGRILLLPENARKQAVGLNFVCSFSQLWATVFFGTIAVGMYSDMLNPGTSHEIFYGLISLLGFILVISIGVFILKMRWMAAWVKNKGIGRKFEPFFAAIAHLPKRVLVKLLLLSVFRYCVFLLQQLLALKLLGVSGISFTHAAALVAMVYFFATMLPINSLLELGIRSGATLHLWGLAYPDFAFIGLAASLLIWFCNVALPVLLGNFFMFRHYQKTN